jgi:YD repeat-containing protein
MKHLTALAALLCLSLGASSALAETYTYDAVGRLTSVSWPGGTTRIYTYDGRGNLVSVETLAQAPPLAYCTAKVNSAGCLPAVGSTGAPSISGGSFVVTAANVLNNKSGLMFWGITPSATPFQGGIKCVAAPTVRTPVQNSGGNPPPNDCSGAYAFGFDSAYMTAKGLAPGATVYCQYWTRDPSAPFTTGLTDGLQFTVDP